MCFEFLVVEKMDIVCVVGYYLYMPGGLSTVFGFGSPFFTD